MVSDAEKMAALPFTHDVDGATYTFSPLGPDGWQKMLVEAKGNRRPALEVLGEQYDSLPLKMRQDALSAAIDQDRQKNRPLTDGQWTQYLASDEGTAYFLWLSLVPNHPDLTRENVAADIVAKLNKAEGIGIVQRIFELSGVMMRAEAEAEANAESDAKKNGETTPVG